MIFQYIISIYFRLVSAFRNKLNPGRPWYRERFGGEIKKKYRKPIEYESLGEVTFPEFVRYIIDLHNEGGYFDEHWTPQYKIVNPCFLSYDYIGKFETFHSDLEYVLKSAYKDSNAFAFFRYEEQTTSMMSNTTKEFFKQITEEQIRKLKEIYLLDFEFFGYDKDLVFK